MYKYQKKKKKKKKNLKIGGGTRKKKKGFRPYHFQASLTRSMLLKALVKSLFLIVDSTGRLESKDRLQTVVFIKVNICRYSCTTYTY
jgi:hypothetical protein